MSASEVITPDNIEVVLTDADAQYTIDLVGVQHFSVQSRSDAAFRFAWATGRVNTATPAGPYITCKAGQVLNSPEKCSTPSGTTLYVASGNAGQVLEVQLWRRMPSV